MVGTWFNSLLLFLLFSFGTNTQVMVCHHAGTPTNKQSNSVRIFAVHALVPQRWANYGTPVWWMSEFMCKIATKTFPGIKKAGTGSNKTTWPNHITQHAAASTDSFSTWPWPGPYCSLVEMNPRPLFSRGPKIVSLDRFQAWKQISHFTNFTKLRAQMVSSLEKTQWWKWPYFK